MASALRTVRRSALPAGFAITVLALSIHAAHADTVTDLGSVGVQAQSGSAAPTSTAAAAAPSSATLQATEPQSIISRTFMDDAKPADADYTAIAAISPSVAGGVTANGPGLGETKNTIRGFQDGQYNITWDGIPFGDTNGPTHHSTAYFPDQVIGSVDVERGPGNADDLGQATYGGSLNLFSRDISNTEVVTPFYSAGSWDTQLKGARYETGVLDNAGGAKASVAYQDLTSDGYLTYSGVQNQNLAFKVEKPIGDKTLLTVDLNHDANQSYTPDASNGITLAQAAALGKNQSLGIDPTQGNYFGYNRADKSTDMDYARLQSDLGSGWAVDNKLYYYNYVNDTFAAANASPGAAPEITSSKCLDINGNKIPNCIPAYEKINKYWVSGDIFKTTKQFDSGQLLAGLWVEHAETFRARTTYDAVNGEEMYTVQATTSPTPVPNDIKYDQNSAWNNYQPFVEYKWTPTDNLTVTPGFKYENTLVNLDAEINQTSREAQNIDKLFTAKLPYLTANYRISNDWWCRTSAITRARVPTAPTSSRRPPPTIRPVWCASLTTWCSMPMCITSSLRTCCRRCRARMPSPSTTTAAAPTTRASKPKPPTLCPPASRYLPTARSTTPSPPPPTWKWPTPPSAPRPWAAFTTTTAGTLPGYSRKWASSTCCRTPPTRWTVTARPT